MICVSHSIPSTHFARRHQAERWRAGYYVIILKNALTYDARLPVFPIRRRAHSEYLIHRAGNANTHFVPCVSMPPDANYLYHFPVSSTAPRRFSLAVPAACDLRNGPVIHADFQLSVTLAVRIVRANETEIRRAHAPIVVWQEYH